MNTQAFLASIEHAGPNALVKPSPIHQRTNPPISLPPADLSMEIEMDPLPPRTATTGSPLNAVGDAQSPVSPKTPNELEMSRPPSSHGTRGTDIVQSFLNPYMNRYRVVAACLLCFGNGLNDSSAGALLSYIEKDYNIGYAVVSTLFVSQALGFISAAPFVNALSLKFGQGKALVFAEALVLGGYTTIVATAPFPVVVIAFFVVGFGMAMNLAISQVFIGNLASSTTLLGVYQGSYGIGGILGPLIATSLVSRGLPWSRFYLLTLGVAAFNIIFAGWSFFHYERDSAPQLLSTLEQTASRQQASETSEHGAKGGWQTFKTTLNNKPTYLGAMFIFAYQGAEVSISGWVISFLVNYRNGDPSRVGYVTAGFWGGITLGRFTLAHFAHYVGERKFVFAVAAGALILELLIWFVPSIPGDSVAVALSGFLLGPVYPAASHLFARLIPRHMQISSISFIASIGASGGALAPFLTGIMAQSFGTFVLHPICITLFVAMTACWWLMPKASKRSE